MNLRTELTWDGAAARAEEIAEARLTWSAGDLVVDVVAPYHRDPPPAAPPGSVPRLWEAEVVELFVGGDGTGADYLEVELGPGGHYLVIRLRGVRCPVEEELPLEFSASIKGNRWKGRARIPKAWLPAAPREGWRVNLTACHGAGEGRRFLTAARLSAEQPDFHRPAEWLPLAGG